jgi:hypothetical protein
VYHRLVILCHGHQKYLEQVMVYFEQALKDLKDPITGSILRSTNPMRSEGIKRLFGYDICYRCFYLMVL